MEYVANIWYENLTKENQDELQRIQNQGLKSLQR